MLHGRKQQASRDSLLRGIKHELDNVTEAIVEVVEASPLTSAEYVRAAFGDVEQPDARA